MNCIDCFWAIQQDESKQCKKASPQIKECDYFLNAERKMIRKEEKREIKMLETMKIEILIMERIIKPYSDENKPLKEAIEDFYEELFGIEIPEGIDEFTLARDKFDAKIKILSDLVQIKKIAENKEDYKILLTYFNKAIAEFKEALKVELEDESK